MDFSKLGQMKEIFEKAKDMQENIKKMKDELDAKTFTGESGGGMVTVTMSGARKCKKIEIADICLQDKEMMQDLIVAAVNTVISKIDEEYKNELSNRSGLPNMGDLPF